VLFFNKIMVTLDKDFKEFSEHYIKWSDKQLLEFRTRHVQNLFAGQIGSQDNEERKALIELVDKELERRYKTRTQLFSFIAIIISVISLLISIFLK
jgi:hypothetical protein